ncbi:MAG: outer membrane protein assembly factor BamA [Deltaproteobacteria bacterium CG11_big_fil_rev_8_21_14_0_20_49_13]|nr:MAG: outer membrane protein assembly factor BamA [Deltaproteobacteria bacterium CG11_big_fil_rev_8_21_14_0_20_49_13]
MRIRAIIAMMFVSASLQAAPIKAININITDSSAGKTTEAQIRNMLPINIGDEFSPQKLDESIDYLRKWGVFETINVDTMTAADGGMEINLFLKEAILIGDIDIQGNYPFIEKRVKKYLTIRPGDMYTNDRIEGQVPKLAAFYDREGFYNTKITADEGWNEYSKDVDVIYKIKRGSILRYREININGMRAFPKGRLVSVINPLFRYNARDFNEAIRKTEGYYHKHGYPRANIKIAKRAIDLDAGRIDVDIEVTEGPKVCVNFTGNKKISSGKLRKAVTIFEEGSFDEFEIDASKKSIMNYYHRNGFDDATAGSSRRTEKDGTIIITFNIVEGPKIKIVGLKFEGNNNISTGKLKHEMKSRELSLTNKGIYNEMVMADDLERMKLYYDKEGYVNTVIGKPRITEVKEGVDITIPIDEDGRTIVKHTNFYGNNVHKKRVLLKRLKNRKNKPFNPLEMENDKKSLLEFYADTGYPYATITQSADLDGLSAVINYDINEGPLVKIGEVLAVGNSLTATASIKKSMSIHEGEPYSYKKIVDSKLGLRRMGAFNSVNIEPVGLSEMADIVHLKVSVEEQKPFIMNVELGYSTDQLFTGSLIFTNLNTFGYAKRSNLALTGGKRLSRGEMSWTDPRFLGSDFELTTSTWLQYQDNLVYTYLQGGGGFGFFRRYHRTGVLAKWELQRNYFIKGSSTAADADSLRNNTVSNVSLSVSWDTRNNFAEPTRGIYTMAGVGFYNEIEGVGANFTKLTWALAQYYGFLKYFILSNNFRVGRIETLGHNISVPSNQLFLMGGDNTIRGYSFASLGPVNTAGNPTGGRSRWIYNTELSTKIYGNFRLAGFYDMGALFDEFNQTGWYNTRRAAGGGLRYTTPVGPMRVDYGVALDRRAGEPFGRFHFTFGYIF